jgi:hypothetical protein
MVVPEQDSDEFGGWRGSRRLFTDTTAIVEAVDERQDDESRRIVSGAACALSRRRFARGWRSGAASASSPILGVFGYCRRDD